MLFRVAITLAAFSMALVPALASERPHLRGDVSAASDVLTLGDLVEGVAGAAASRPLFRAPALGETGTIQAHRIIDAAAAAGVPGVDTGGRAQIAVTRAARRAGETDIEIAVKRALEAQAGIDVRPLSIVFEGQPVLLVAPEATEPVSVEDLTFDRRSRRVSALVAITSSAGVRRASLRVAGALVELVEVAVLNRTLNRGETVQAADIAVERRARETVSQDIQTDASDLVGRVARRALSAGSTIRIGDLTRPEIVARGDMVTIVYEIPGMTLTLRGRANEGGSQGDTIAVANPQSKRVLQAQVVAPGKVSVSAAVPGPVALAGPAQQSVQRQ
jgi:flagella basal body P-ring formation protein FlgA